LKSSKGFRRAGTIVHKVGRSAVSFLRGRRHLRKQIDAVSQRLHLSKENVESWLLGIEEELWVWINRMQDQAHRAQSQMDRAKNADKYYHTLGLEPGAQMDQVKAAWRQAMRHNHPDRFAHDPKAEAAAHRRSQELNFAYAELSALLTGREGRRSE
jgi:hypothetical protein